MSYKELFFKNKSVDLAILSVNQMKTSVIDPTH